MTETNRPEPKADDPADNAEIGRNLLSQGLVGEARRLFENMLAEDGGDPSACYYLGLIAGKGGDQAGAAGYFQRAVSIRPDFDQAREALASVLVKNQQWAPALEHLDHLLSRNPASPKLHEFAAFVCRRLGRPDQAADHLRRALALAPDNADLAAALAGFAGGQWRDPWPEMGPAADPFQLSARYGLFPAESTAPAIRLARALGGLDNPLALASGEPPRPSSPPRPQEIPFSPPPPADLKGLSVLFGPTVIAGVSPRMARFLRTCGARASTVEYVPTYLNYEVDFLNKSSDQAGLIRFSDEMVKKALEHDVICLDFCCSFKHLPFLGIDLRNEKAKNIPYPDLHYLKQQNKKLMCFVWGSDAWSQASIHYHYLTFLGIGNIPEPPLQTKTQHQLISRLEKVVDCFVAPQYFLSVLPKTVPDWDICLEEKDWPAKAVYNDKISKILLAPTSKRKKNYDIMHSAVKSISQKYGYVTEYTIEGRRHQEVPGLYAQADLGLEQATGQFGLLAVEMMALGLPVVGTFSVPAFGSFRESAPILKYANVRQLVDILDSCVADPPSLKQIGKSCREYALEYHTSTVQGKLLSQYISQIISNDSLDHIDSPAYKTNSDIWSQDPATVDKFRYFDISVPLFCSLGKYDYAEIDCSEAVANGYNVGKFLAYSLAITKFMDNKKYDSKKLAFVNSYGSVDVLQMNHFFDTLSSSKKLIDEAVFWLNKVNS